MFPFRKILAAEDPLSTTKKKVIFIVIIFDWGAILSALGRLWGCGNVSCEMDVHVMFGCAGYFGG